MPLKVLLVTSRVTLVPDNYFGFIEGVLQGAKGHIVGLVLLENLNKNILTQAAGLSVAGALRLGRGLVANATSTLPRARDPRAQLFAKNKLPILRVSNMSSPEVFTFLKEHKVDLIVNARTRDIYKKATLAAPRLGCVNIHHGLLPEERGVNCDLFAMAENRPAGFSIHVMTPKIDDGRILVRQEVPYANTKDYLALQYTSSLAEAQALSALIFEISELDALPEGQPNLSSEVQFRRVKPTFKTIRWFKNQGVLL